MTLADRIVVLNKGRIEQTGTPLQIYRKPSNLFVAEFIGTPRINVLPAKLAASGGSKSTAVSIAGQQLEVPRNLPASGEKRKTSALRPEHIVQNGRRAGQLLERPHPVRRTPRRIEPRACLVAGRVSRGASGLHLRRIQAGRAGFPPGRLAPGTVFFRRWPADDLAFLSLHLAALHLVAPGRFDRIAKLSAGETQRLRRNQSRKRLVAAAGLYYCTNTLLH